MTPIKIDGVYYAFWTCVTGYCNMHVAKQRDKASLRTRLGASVPPLAHGREL